MQSKNSQRRRTDSGFSQFCKTCYILLRYRDGAMNIRLGNYFTNVCAAIM